MFDPHAYNITVRRDEFEGEVCFEARVRELPDLVEYGDSFDEAYALAIDAIETTAVVFAEKGRSMPPPQTISDNFSGRVTLRLPKSLHRALNQSADGEGVSLNQYLVTVLSYYSGFASATRGEHDAPWTTVEKPSSTKRRHNLRLVHSSNLDGKDGWQKTG